MLHLQRERRSKNITLVSFVGCDLSDFYHTFFKDHISSQIDYSPRIKSHSTQFLPSLNIIETPKDNDTTSTTKHEIFPLQPPPSRAKNHNLRIRLHLRQRALPGRPLESIREAEESSAAFRRWGYCRLSPAGLPACHPTGPNIGLQANASRDFTPADGAERGCVWQ